MANKFANGEKNRQEDEDTLEVLDEVNHTISASKSKRLIRWVNPHEALVLSVKSLHMGKICAKDPIFNPAHSLEYRISRPVVSLDEKYLRRCLELIHFRAAKTVRCNASEKIGALSEGLSRFGIRSGESFDPTRYVFECSMVSGDGSVISSPSGHWIWGTITGSKSMSMSNILKSPLFHQYGALDNHASFADSNYRDVLVDSPSPLHISSPLRSVMSTPSRERHKHGNDHSELKKRTSISSSNSVCSDQTSSAVSTTVYQGMLQCTWKNGFPHFVFTTDDHKDVYFANLWKVESRDEKALDYVYLFHSGKSGKNEHEVSDDKSHVIGKMKVSNSFTLGVNGAKELETEFVLFGGNGGYITEISSLGHNLKTSRGFSKKMTEVFRSKHKAVSSKFSGPCPIQENTSLDSGIDDNGSTFLDDHPLPNFELAAIVVKDRIKSVQKEEAGGWGLKFLKNVGVKPSAKSPESTSSPFECYRNNGDCSTSMEILIPSGLHGGPRIRNLGPSSLTERWRSGGNCDCGGWDTGCPLTLLTPGPKNDETTPEQEEFKSFDLVAHGSKHKGPTVRIVSVNDGLYFIHFQRTLTVLQSFSIAVATIHTRSSALRPKDVHELK